MTIAGYVLTIIKSDGSERREHFTSLEVAEELRDFFLERGIAAWVGRA